MSGAPLNGHLLSYSQAEIIAAILGDETGALLEQARVLPAAAFTDSSCAVLWRALLTLKPGAQPAAALVGCGLSEPELRRISEGSFSSLNFAGHLRTLHRAWAKSQAKLLTADFDADRLSLEDFAHQCGDLYAAGNEHTGIKTRLAEARLKFDVEPPPLRTIFKLNGTCIATPGNLVALLAQAKAGKTAFVGAAIGSTMTGSLDCDFLGIAGTNPNSFAVVHVDTEQAPADHYHVIRTALRRAGLDRAPTWLHSYATSGWSPTDRRTMLPHMLAIARKEHGGIHAAFIDGIADFINDPNAGDECFPFVDSLQALAVKFDCPIFAVIHQNPGTEKGRGHLGSQLERRAETNLMLEKDADAGRTVVYSTKQRRAPILKSDGPCFRWDDAEGMHVSVETVRAGRDAEEAEGARELAAEAFGAATALRYSALLAAIKTACGCSERTAERKFQAMRKHRVINKAELGHWRKAG